MSCGPLVLHLCACVGPVPGLAVCFSPTVLIISLNLVVGSRWPLLCWSCTAPQSPLVRWRCHFFQQDSGPLMCANPGPRPHPLLEHPCDSSSLSPCCVFCLQRSVVVVGFCSATATERGVAVGLLVSFLLLELHGLQPRNAGAWPVFPWTDILCWLALLAGNGLYYWQPVRRPCPWPLSSSLLSPPPPTPAFYLVPPRSGPVHARPLTVCVCRLCGRRAPWASMKPSTMISQRTWSFECPSARRPWAASCSSSPLPTYFFTQCYLILHSHTPLHNPNPSFRSPTRRPPVDAFAKARGCPPPSPPPHCLRPQARPRPPVS